MNNADKSGFLPPQGNYEELLSYQKAEVVYDLTRRFCRRFLDARARTVDQNGASGALGQTAQRTSDDKIDSGHGSGGF